MSSFIRPDIALIRLSVALQLSRIFADMAALPVYAIPGMLSIDYRHL